MSSDYKNAALKYQFQIKCAFVALMTVEAGCTSNHLSCPVRTDEGRSSPVVTKEGDGDGHAGDQEENLDSEQQVEKCSGKTHRPLL